MEGVGIWPRPLHRAKDPTDPSRAGAAFKVVVARNMSALSGNEKVPVMKPFPINWAFANLYVEFSLRVYLASNCRAGFPRPEPLLSAH